MPHLLCFYPLRSIYVLPPRFAAVRRSEAADRRLKGRMCRTAKEHPELALSALLRAVMVCHRPRDVGSRLRRFLDKLFLGKNAPPPSTRVKEGDAAPRRRGEWIQGHE